MLWRLWRTVHHGGGEQGGVDWGERERDFQVKYLIYFLQIHHPLFWGEKERYIFSSQAFVNTSGGVKSKEALAGW